MSYDMIREQHRQRYRPVFQQPPQQQQHQQSSSMPPYHGVPPPVASGPDVPSSIPVQRRPAGGGSTNKYGDEGFE